MGPRPVSTDTRGGRLSNHGRSAAAILLVAALLGGCGRSSGGGGGGNYVVPLPPPPPPPTPLTVDLDVDTNRNGVVEASADEAGEETWSTTRGAVFYYNIDDHDNNNAEGYIDSAVNGSTDALDLSRIVIRQI